MEQPYNLERLIMGKTKGGKSSGNVSGGVHKNTATNTKRLMKQGYKSSIERILNQQKALLQGKDIVVTIPNPNTSETNKPFIRQRVSGKSYLNSLKGGYVMKEVQ